MKTTITLLFAIFLVSFCSAQTLGLKGGLNICTLQTVEDDGFESGDELSDNMNGSGFNAGLYYTKHFGNEKMHLRTELLYSNLKVSSSDLYTGSENNGVYIGANGNPDGTTRIDLETVANYASLPILFQYDVTEKISLQLGPSFNYLVKSREDSEISNVSLATSGGFDTAVETSCCESIRSVKAFDTQVMFGAEFQLAESINLGLRYSKGINDFYGFFNDSEDFFEADDIQFIENSRWNSFNLYLAFDLAQFSKKDK